MTAAEPATSGDATTAEPLREAPPVVLETFVRQARERYRSGVIGVNARARWDGPELRDPDGTPIRVVACVSALAVREALLAWDPEEWLIVLTERTGDDLGEELLGHMLWPHLRIPSLWEAVAHTFQARLDRMLTREGRAVADALLTATPPEGWPPVRGGVLTRDAAFEALADRVLGIPPARLDALGLLEWTLDPVAVTRLDRLLIEARERLQGWIGERAGPAGRCTLEVVRAGHGPDAVPLALVAGLLASQERSVRAAETRGRLGASYGGRTPMGSAATIWGETARDLIERQLAANQPVDRLLDHAERLLHDAGAGKLAETSGVLPSGLAHRLRQLASELRSAVDEHGHAVPEGAVAACEGAYRELAAHVLNDPATGRPEARRVATAQAALRLVRWLATEERHARTPASAVSHHVTDSGWVDRARARVWTGDDHDDPLVARAYQTVYAAATARRARADARFAELLTAHTAANADHGKLLHVEDVLPRVVLPLARKEPVLLVVVDGMSVAVAAELAEAVTTASFVELLPRGQQWRRGVLAVLPTVTEVNRVTLLGGRLGHGGQAEEHQGLAARVRAAGLDTTLFHKADLERSSAGETLPAHVRQALGDNGPRLVAVVLNSVDDTLDSGDPGRTEWNLQTVSHLRALLDQARDAGRVVVLVSDHGHVVERRDGELRQHSVATARWRPESREAPAGDGEIGLRGKRVLLGGGRVVLPWQETIRYVPVRAGYHGGASLAEAVIPLVVFSPRTREEPKGWEPAPPQTPTWWLGALPPMETLLQRPAPAEVVTQRPGRVSRAKPPEATRPPARMAPSEQDGAREAPRLFEQEPTPPAATQAAQAPAAPIDLVDQVLHSEVYDLQRRRARRLPIDDGRVAAVLRALRSNGGRLPQTVLAAAVGVPEFRLPGVLSALQRLLNVDGYEVVGYDPDGETIRLDEPLLREQFQLEGAA